MKSRDFVYWLQGFFELNGSNDPISPLQTQLIKDHLAMVFVHEIDPSMDSSEHQVRIDVLHTKPEGLN